jgi:putative PIN family toxin of toxin-antitoxin system
MKIVLDTNVVVSSLLTPSGLPAKILNLVLDGSVTIVYDNNILAEYADVCNRDKFNIDKALFGLVMDFIAKEGEFRIAGAPTVQSHDEDEAIFYPLYKSGGIDYLITGNIKHFPHEKGIVTPRKFLELSTYA